MSYSRLFVIGLGSASDVRVPVLGSGQGSRLGLAARGDLLLILDFFKKKT